MPTLITGAAGFVGLNVTEHLLRAGREVVAFDTIPLPARARQTFSTQPGKLTNVLGSILSAADLARAFATSSIDHVIHCAVITAGPEREETDAEGIVAVNVQGAVATLAAATRSGAKRFVYTSSIAVYGTSAMGGHIIHEELECRPVMIYGMTKRACEILLPRIAEVGGLGFAAARLASVFGPWEYATGVRDTLSPMLSALQQARNGEEAVLSRPGLGDFIYSRDAAAGLVALAHAPALTQTVYNLGSGAAHSAEDWCNALATRIPNFRWRRAALGETANTVSHVPADRGAMDITAIARDTGYHPRFTLVEAATDYLAWSDA